MVRSIAIEYDVANEVIPDSTKRPDGHADRRAHASIFEQTEASGGEGIHYEMSLDTMDSCINGVLNCLDLKPSSDPLPELK